MMLAEMAAFDNLEELIEMTKDLTTFVREAVVEGTAAHKVEKGVWQRVLAMGRQATGQFFQMQGDRGPGCIIMFILPDRPIFPLRRCLRRGLNSVAAPGLRHVHPE